MGGFQSYFLKEAKPFTSKREVNWVKVKWIVISFVVILVLGIIAWPSPKPEQDTFYEKADKGSLNQPKSPDADPTQVTINQFKDSQIQAQQIPKSIDYLYRSDSNPGPGSGRTRGSSSNQNSSMILGRAGNDARTQLLAGTKISIRLTGKVTIENTAIPVVGIIASDVSSESGIAIPSGSKVLGNASFDGESERASISWQSIILPDGRERPFSAMGIGRDGETGISGNVQSEGLKNVVGQTLTRFVGAYAAGSMNTGAFGANQGGHANGLRNAIAETATAQANDMGQDLQKERKWIEIDSGSETTAILTQPFSFRDAGALYGQ